MIDSLWKGNPKLFIRRKGQKREGVHSIIEKINWLSNHCLPSIILPSLWMWVHVQDIFLTKAMQFFHLVFKLQGISKCKLKALTIIKESLSINLNILLVKLHCLLNNKHSSTKLNHVRGNTPCIMNKSSKKENYI